MSRERVDTITLPLQPTPIAIPCFDFTTQNGQFEKRTVVIVPNSIHYYEDGAVIGWSCSRGKFCCDRNCFYSYTSKKGRKRDEESIEPFASYGDR